MAFDINLYRRALRYIQDKPLVVYGPRVLVLRDAEETMTKGGLYVPDQAQKKKRSGTVVALGQGYEKAGEDEFVHGVCVGHSVAFNAYDGVAHTFEDNEGAFELIALHVGNLYMGWPNKEVTGGA